MGGAWLFAVGLKYLNHVLSIPSDIFLSSCSEKRERWHFSKYILFSYYVHLSFGSNYILTLLIELPKLYQIFSCKRSNEVKNYWDEGLCVGWKTN